MCKPRRPCYSILVGCCNHQHQHQITSSTGPPGTGARALQRNHISADIYRKLHEIVKFPPVDQGQVGTVHDILKHIPRCPDSGACHAAHRKLAQALWDVLREAGASKHDLCWELAGLRPGHADRPGDVVWKDFFGPGRHLVVDCCCTSVRRDDIEKYFDSPGRAAREAEQRKFDNDDTSHSPVRTAGHTLAPFVMEDGGRFGEHALALLWNLALRGTGPRGCLSRPLASGGQSTCCPTPTATASWYVNKWLGSLSWTMARFHASQLLQTLRISD